MVPGSPIAATMPCRQCDAQISAIAEICPHCGVRQFSRPETPVVVSDRRVLPAALLCFFLGIFGAHRFYVGKIGTGLLQFFTVGGLGIWALIDLLMILLGAFRDAEGRKLTEWV